MFTSLHELAKKATLMITIAAEGDDQLRVNVTPVPFDTKAKSNLPQPLSLVASPAEFDADFGAALITWHAPKRSLIEQAQAATGGAPAAAPALPTPKTSTKTDKPGKKGRGKGGADEELGAAPAGGDAAGNASAAAGEATKDDTEAVESQQAPAHESGQPTGADSAIEPVAADGAPEASAAAPAAPVPQGAPANADQGDVDTFTLDLWKD